MHHQHDLTTPDQILNTALEKETEARDFYAELSENCSVSFVKDLLQKLQEEESQHVRMIQAMLERLKCGKKIV